LAAGREGEITAEALAERRDEAGSLEGSGTHLLIADPKDFHA